jgi:hypothetical protein
MGSASPLSGGLGFLILGFFEFIVLIAGWLGAVVWQPLELLCAPFVGWLIMVAALIVFAGMYQGFQSAIMKRIGYK